jgi:chorismate mutase
MIRYTPFLVSSNSQEEIRKADADLMDKVNEVNAALDSRIILLNNEVDSLNVPTIIDDPTYGRYRSYPD